ncbi:MAG: hypothetical protein ACREDR_12035, partial [Blastocatellia bacterium]
QGAAAKNVLWRPRIQIAAVPQLSKLTLKITWRLRLTTGQDMDQAQTPPYPEQKYPITLTKTFTRE